MPIEYSKHDVAHHRPSLKFNTHVAHQILLICISVNYTESKYQHPAKQQLSPAINIKFWWQYKHLNDHILLLRVPGAIHDLC